MIVGVKSFYSDGTPSVQLWDTRTGEQFGEFVSGSPKIPESAIICSTIGEFNYWMERVR